MTPEDFYKMLNQMGFIKVPTNNPSEQMFAYNPSQQESEINNITDGCYNNQHMYTKDYEEIPEYFKDFIKRYNDNLKELDNILAELGEINMVYYKKLKKRIKRVERKNSKIMNVLSQFFNVIISHILRKPIKHQNDTNSQLNDITNDMIKQYIDELNN